MLVVFADLGGTSCNKQNHYLKSKNRGFDECGVEESGRDGGTEEEEEENGEEKEG